MNQTLTGKLAATLACSVILLDVTRYASGETCPDVPPRRVERNVLISDRDPALRIRVKDSLPYVGAFRFPLKGVACVERHVFAEAKKGTIRRLFIVQFEGIFDSSEMTYRWTVKRPIRLGGVDYHHNMWAFDSDALIRQDPDTEPAHTRAFLASKGLAIDAEAVMSRFARIVGENRKHELILFYIEPLAGTGLRVRDFPDGDPTTPAQQQAAKRIEERSLRTFVLEEAPAR